MSPPPGQIHPGFRRSLLVGIGLASSLGIFLTSERCFEKADIRNAVTMVQSLRASPTAPTIPEALVARYPGLELERVAWSGIVTDKYYGFVRVTALLPDAQGGLAYVFDVNLAGQRLHPGNERARALMTELGGVAPQPSPLPLSSDEPAH